MPQATANIKEALMNELTPTHGIVHYIPIDGTYLTDPINIIPTSVEDEIIIVNYAPASRARVIRAKINESKILSIVWDSGILGKVLTSADYSPSLNRVLVGNYTDGEMWELDADTGAVLNNLTAGGRCWSITYHQESLGCRTAFKPDLGNHIVNAVNLDSGALTPIFGVSGVLGADLTHLNYPLSVEYSGDVKGTLDTYWIVDNRNNRLLKVRNTDKTVTVMMLIASLTDMTVRRDPISESYNCRWGYNVQSAFARGGIARYAQSPSGWVSPPGGSTRTLARFGTPDNFDKPIWGGNPNHLWAVAGEQIVCYDIRYYKEPTRIGYFHPILRNQSVLAGATYPPATDPYRTLINGLDAHELEIEVYSSQTATAYIDVPEQRYAGYEVALTFTWKQYDTFPLVADQVIGYILANPPNIFRVRVVMGGLDGVVSIYYNKKSA